MSSSSDDAKTPSPTTALVLCPEGSTVDRRLLGLTVGERVLLALSFSGIERVAFVGAGPRPSSDRAEIAEVELATLQGEPLEQRGAVVVTSADCVFDRKLIGAPDDAPSDLALRFVDALPDDADDADAWLSRLGEGAPDAATVKAGAGFAIRVRDRRSAAAAKRALLRSLRKPIDGFVSRHLNRYISTTTTRLLVRTGLSPNHFTVLFMLIGVGSGVLAAFAEHWWALLAAGLMFQAQSILDGCDGEMARLTYRFSHVGQWMDSVGDDLTNYLFTLGLGIGIARVYQANWFYIVAGVTFAVQCAASAIMYRRMIIWGTGDLLAIPDTVTSGEATTAWAKVLKVARTMAKRDTFVFITAALVAAQLPVVAYATIGGGTYPMFIGVVVNDLRVSKLTPPGRAPAAPPTPPPAEPAAG